MKFRFLLAAYMVLVLASFNLYAQENMSRHIFEIKIYQISSEEQEAKIDDFLKNAYIPAMHQKGIDHIGVFKPIKTDSLADKCIYVFTPFPTVETYMETVSNLHLSSLPSGKDYQDASYKQPPFDRQEAIVLKAFSGMPGYGVPKLKGPKKERIYELRSYESPTEKLFHNKVKMFNSGEIDIFDRLNFNAIFYGEVVAGPQMPNLMYMTSFENMEAEKAAWKSFGNDPGWIKLRDDKIYQNNVSHIDITLLYPAEYSEL